jgi:hypothetical protein
VLLNEPIRRRDLGFMLVIGIGMSLFFVGRQETFRYRPRSGARQHLALRERDHLRPDADRFALDG